MLDLIKKLIDFILHLDVHMAAITRDYGAWTYALLFVIIFAETGLVVTPFLPGDSLLFVAGSLSALPGSGLNIYLLMLLLSAAAIIGNIVNYSIGSYLGPKVFSREDSFLLRKKHLERAHAFFQKYGGVAIILSRFVPVVRTFVPFVAGVGKMDWKRFWLYNAIGGISWVCIFLLLGYFFGQLEFVKKHFELVVPAIIVISLIPLVVEVIRARMEAKKEKAAQDAPPPEK